MNQNLFLTILLLLCFSAVLFGEPLGLSLEAQRLDMINEESIDNLMGKCINYRIDTLYIPIVSFMESLYESRILPRSNVLINNESMLTFDPLAYAMKKGEIFGIRIIPVVDLLTVWPSQDLPNNPLHLSKKQPDWLSRNSEGKLLYNPVLLDPGAPQVQNFIIALVKEILIHYKPSQLAFTNFYYPNPEYGYNPYALKEYEQYLRDNHSQIANFNNFRQDTLNKLMVRLDALVQTLGLTTRLLVYHTSNYENSLSQHFQDWVYWLNSDYVDTGIMWYWFTDKKNVAHDTQWALEHIKGQRIIPTFSPDALQYSQFLVVMNTILDFPVSGIMVDTVDSSLLEILNNNEVGIPR